jgi:hypothetical protein
LYRETPLLRPNIEKEFNFGEWIDPINRTLKPARNIGLRAEISKLKVTPRFSFVNGCCPNDCNGEFVTEVLGSVAVDVGAQLSLEFGWRLPIPDKVKKYQTTTLIPPTGKKCPDCGAPGNYWHTQTIGADIDVKLVAVLTGDAGLTGTLTATGIYDDRCPSWCIDGKGELRLNFEVGVEGKAGVGFKRLVASAWRGFHEGARRARNDSTGKWCVEKNYVDVLAQISGKLISGAKGQAGYRIGHCAEGTNGWYDVGFCMKDGDIVFEVNANLDLWFVELPLIKWKSDPIQIWKGNCP